MALPEVEGSLTRALLDSFAEGLLILDSAGRVVYANRAGEETLARVGIPDGGSVPDLLARLTGLRPRFAPLGSDASDGLQAVFLPPESGALTLSDRERTAILDTLDATGWRLAETARRLGISRTTLWRRLKRYGLRRERHAGWLG